MGRKKAVWSLVWGILALIIWPLSFIFGPFGLTLGIDALRKNEKGRSMAIWGIVTASLGLLFLLIFCFLAYFGVLGPDFTQPSLGPAVVVDAGFVLKAGDSHRFMSFD